MKHNYCINNNITVKAKGKCRNMHQRSPLLLPLVTVLNWVVYWRQYIVAVWPHRSLISGWQRWQQKSFTWYSFITLLYPENSSKYHQRPKSCVSTCRKEIPGLAHLYRAIGQYRISAYMIPYVGKGYLTYIQGILLYHHTLPMKSFNEYE